MSLQSFVEFISYSFIICSENRHNFAKLLTSTTATAIKWTGCWGRQLSFIHFIPFQLYENYRAEQCSWNTHNSNNKKNENGFFFKKLIYWNSLWENWWDDNILLLQLYVGELCLAAVTFFWSYLHTSAKRVRIAWKSVYFDIFIFINHFNFIYIFSLSASMPLYYKKLQGKRHNFSTDNNSRYEITAECPVSICVHIRPLISQTNSTHFYSQTQIICCRCKLTAKV